MVASQKVPQKSKTNFIKSFPIYEPLDRPCIPTHALDLDALTKMD